MLNPSDHGDEPLLGEGKTYVSVTCHKPCNDLDTRVLLVDADASRPAVLERLGLPAARPFDLLVNPTPCSAKSFCHQCRRLSILPAALRRPINRTSRQ
jgi:Mrp family chromosome partitioning ATPase